MKNHNLCKYFNLKLRKKISKVYVTHRTVSLMKKIVRNDKQNTLRNKKKLFFIMLEVDCFKKLKYKV